MPAITYQAAIDKYGDVQGNIIKGHGRDHAALLFVEFTNPAPAREWIRSLRTGEAGVRLTSTADQLRETLRFKEFGIPGNLFAMLLLSASGIQKLGQAVPQEANQTPQLAAQGLPHQTVFEQGMRSAAARQRLKDPDPKQWEKGWFESGTDTPTPIDALLLLADDDWEGVQHAARAIQEKLPAAGVELRLVDWGHSLRNDNGDGIEHFGYADGVSQPIYLQQDAPNHEPEGTAKDTPLWEDVDRWDPTLHTPEELVLVPDSLGSGAGAMGSFMVYRKLQQQVTAFKEAEERLARRLGLAPGDEERAGAMLVGRYEDGTPLVERGAQGLISPIVNNFTYAEDEKGSRCPFHAHIRKTNPRGETKHPEERLHMITRRGIPFGSAEEAKKEDGKPVGLLFMCFQRSIQQQFEFIQSSWANDADFLFGQNKPGIDPIIGQVDVGEDRGKYRFNYTYGASGCRKSSFGGFVSLLGGEYFYAPSLSGLDKLATAPEGAN
ncbi:Dyp-type peroxidase [Hymenobacter cellulosilyticus]|uniref:Dyp-type peroxidase n=1 Tax=Hymenobacter cellulosilyticus TaxID=2932248 RepID=A0A8T9Q5C5_9BACT|nr:Dyp-type peroxidase [Hymenobacter cellulosilyticus]UOQ71631.1 Dyp-type peroxidase [Hymenobacter cellulosilyticus]